MRILYLTSAILLGLGLSSCSRDNSADHRNEPTAREAGREAYRASQQAKRDAKEAAKELRRAGKEFREGWNEEKHKDPPPPPSKRQDSRPDKH